MWNLNDAYFSVREALYHAALYHDRELNLLWVHSEDLEKDGADALLRHAQGIIVPGGFGIRGIEGMIKAVKYARENKIPYLGLCLGMQVMVIEFARHVFCSDEPTPPSLMPPPAIRSSTLCSSKRQVTTKGATMRLGNYPCQLLRAAGRPMPMARPWFTSATGTAMNSIMNFASRCKRRVWFTAGYLLMVNWSRSAS